MALFQVAFRLSGSVTVDCDDERDALSFVENAGVEEMLRCTVCQRQAQLDKDVIALSVKPLVRPRGMAKGTRRPRRSRE